MTELTESLELCNECGAYLQVCLTYKVTQNEDFSPIGRIKAARKIFQGAEATPQISDKKITYITESILYALTKT